LDARRRAPPGGADQADIAAMIDALEPGAGETRGGAPAVIYLPDQSRPVAVRKQPKRQRRHVDHFRTDDAEHAELAARAGAAGLSVDAYCRLKTVGEPGLRSRRSQPTMDSRLRAQHITAINQAGNLVNQGIHALHEIKLAASAAVSRDRLADEIARTRELLEAAIPVLAAALTAAAFGDDREG
jgi:hypothetical protein